MNRAMEDENEIMKIDELFDRSDLKLFYIIAVIFLMMACIMFYYWGYVI